MITVSVSVERTRNQFWSLDPCCREKHRVQSSQAMVRLSGCSGHWDYQGAQVTGLVCHQYPRVADVGQGC